MSEENKTTPVLAPTVYEECTEKVGLRRHSGEFYDAERREVVAYTSYYLTLADDVRIKISLDSEKKALMTKYVPFAPVEEEVGVE